MKPIAFRIKNFKSIRDSQICHLSADGITVLAGENESGKTAILSALRDFDRDPEEQPETKDYLPDDDLDRQPEISVCFDCNWDELFVKLEERDVHLAASVQELLRENRSVWITRRFEDNDFYFDQALEDRWNEINESASIVESKTNDEGVEEARKITPADAQTVLAEFYSFWPKFVYFDAFDDILPRQIKFGALRPAKGAPISASAIPGTASVPSKGRNEDAPQIVLDFLKLADIDIDQISKIADNEKLLTNYLGRKNAAITWDFLSFWRRTDISAQSFLLRVAHYRNQEGELLLTFYVKDSSDQYLDQRSRGFRWFLSFYIRLAASRAEKGERPNFLLIDEPGSFLHARAQRDVLSLFEKRIVDRDSVVYSTHSPYLIPADKLFRLKIILKTDDAGTHIADKLSDQELQQEEFTDTLSPILTAIGIDIREQLRFVGKANIVVEGLSDFLYLQSFKSLVTGILPEDVSIFPCTGATTTVLLSSLFIGWDLNFIVALDNDDQGHEARRNLIRDMGLSSGRVVQMKDGNAIEDVISTTDFGSVLSSLNPTYKMESAEKPGRALKRLKVSKIVSAKQFADLVSSGEIAPNKTTIDAIMQYLKQLSSAFKS